MAQNVPLIAPNQYAAVQQTIAEHPEIDTMDEEARGEIIDITARRLNPGHGEKPWGRKARNNDPNNPALNTDGMTFLRPDGLFEIIDVISGVDGSATWDECGAFAPGENGYWWPPNEVEDSGGGGGVPPSDLEPRVAALEAQVAELAQQNADQQQVIDDLIAKLEAFVTGGLHCHGPVDLPLVLESLTRLRAKGDISVEVKPGHATPPPESTGEPPSLVDAVLLKRLLDRLRPEATDE
jgi:hypothetical protein